MENQHFQWTISDFNGQFSSSQTFSLPEDSCLFLLPENGALIVSFPSYKIVIETIAFCKLTRGETSMFLWIFLWFFYEFPMFP